MVRGIARQKTLRFRSLSDRRRTYSACLCTLTRTRNDRASSPRTTPVRTSTFDLYRHSNFPVIYNVGNVDISVQLLMEINGKDLLGEYI